MNFAEKLIDMLSVQVQILFSRKTRYSLHLVQISDPIDRMKRILQADDKRATIQEMAKNNEIDKSLIVLIRENSYSAQRSGNTDVSKFLEKVATVCEEVALKEQQTQT